MRAGSGIAAAAVLIGLMVAGTPAVQARPNDPGFPTQAQVDRSRAEVHARQQRVDAIRAAVAATNARVAMAHTTATDAAEAYSAAAYELVQARQAARRTAAKAGRAQARVDAQRQGIGQLVAQSYQLGASLDGVTTFMTGGDPGTIMDRQAVLQGASLRMNLRLQEFHHLARAAIEARKEALAARKKADRLQRAADVARDMAQLTETAADNASARFHALQGRLVGELGQAQHITAQLASQRQHALQAIAAAAATATASAPKPQPQAPRIFVPWLTNTKPTKPLEIPRTYPGPVDNPPPPDAQAAKVAIAFAKQQLGDMYLWAATGPDRWDCSGLTMGAWKAAGVSLPHYSEAQYLTSIPIRATDLAPGDLVFWQGAQVHIHHVALYIGDGRIIQAWKSGQPVQITDLRDFSPPDFFARPRS